MVVKHGCPHRECRVSQLGPAFTGIAWSNSVKKQQAVAGSGLEAAGGAVAAAWREGNFLKAERGGRRFCGRPCGHAATVATVEVPQIQLSPETVDIPVVQQRRVLDLQQCWLWRR